ncbi:MAG: helix-turn-helix transcriptional regulator [Clostridia bacterium]|nr:helix-turn-helix transcriptional regulator [Clostridia bacterium]
MNKSYILKNVAAVHKIPTNKRLNQNNRSKAAFLYITKGNYAFTTERGGFSAGEGDIIYLPKYSCYSFIINSDKAEGIMVDFDLETEKEVLISKVPLKICANAEQKQTVNELLLCFYRDEQFEVLSKLFKLISMFETEIEGKEKFGKISPAVDFLKTDFDKVVSVKELAALCGLSESHFRRLFLKKMGMSPKKYKNSILMKHASVLLKSEDMNISEVAESLNFCSIYAFSRAFKKEMGVSPKKYSQM